MIKEFNLLDNITIYSSAHISADDTNVLSLLYAPLIKSDAYKLYMTLAALLNRSSLSSQTFLNKELLDILGFNNSEFYHARIRLEAIGLMSSYKSDSEYLLFIKTPLTAKQFLTDGVLGMYLYAEIGDVLFRKVQKLFQIPKLEKSNFTEITSSFDDVFKSIDEIKIENDEYLLDHKMNRGIKINNYDFNFNLFQTGIAKTFLEGKRITKRFETFIINLAYAYGFNENLMQEIYNQSLNSSGNFDYTLCSKKAREKYAQMHEAQLPKIAEKENFEMSEVEELFASLTAKKLLETSTGTKIALAKDIDKVMQLYQEYSFLPRSVVNVCVAYAIKKCDGEIPPYNYFDTVLKDWVNKGIVSFDLAQEIALKEKKTNQDKKTSKKTKNSPEWLDEYVKKFEDEVDDL